jgi:MFS family permease
VVRRVRYGHGDGVQVSVRTPAKRKEAIDHHSSIQHSFGYLNAFGVFQSYYAQGFLRDYTNSDIAWIGALQYFFIFGVGLFAGRAFDLGLFKPLMAFAILLAAFSQMMLSLCTTYYQIFLAQGVGLGIAMGLLFNLAVGIPTHWFKRRRATALGVSATGSSIGGVIFPILLQRLLPQIGFPWTMRLIGFGYLILLGLSWFLMDTRLPPVQDARNGGWRKVKWFEISAFRNPAYTLFVVGCLAALFGLYTPFVYMDLFTHTYRIPADGYWISILNASSTFGRVIPGVMGDHFGRINTLLPHMVLAVIFLLIFPVFTNLSLIAFTLVYGYCSGCFVSIIAPCVAQLGATNTVGTRLGMMFAIMSVGGLLGTPISGFILGDQEPYRWWATSGYSGGAVFLSVIACTAARQFAVKNKLRSKI